MNHLPKISIITVSYNYGEFIRQTIDSVKAQNYANLEHIVIDGGSTDNTVEILKEYPDLIWVSEPDRGQTHALNKGLKMATGDIVTWLNADDWFQPGILHDVARAMERTSLVFGMCQLTDRDGAPKELIHNLPRSWFDILKYWIYYSVPAQPSIFFTRELLNKVKLFNGDYLDETLNYCMDYELWLRMMKFSNFDTYIPKVLSYYRDYDTNKTGANMPAVYQEMRRVYQRHSKQFESSERDVSIIIEAASPVDFKLENQREVLSAFGKNLELVVLDRTPDRKSSRQLFRLVEQAVLENPSLNIRYIKGNLTIDENTSRLADINYAIGNCYSEIAILWPSDLKLNVEQLEKIKASFSQEQLALMIGSNNQQQNGKSCAEASYLFNESSLPPSFAIRKTAWCEFNGFNTHEGFVGDVLAFRGFLLNLTQGGWASSLTTMLPGALKDGHHAESETLALYNKYINAQLLINYQVESQKDPFLVTRRQHGFAWNIPEALFASSQRLLAEAPRDWLNIEAINEWEEWNRVVKSYPNYSPGWFRLAQAEDRLGATERIAEIIHNFHSCTAQENEM